MNHRPSFLVGLIGTGVGPSLTPAMHMVEGRAQGFDYVYRTLDGGHMAVHQAVDAFALITGTAPDAARMSRHFRELVANPS